MSAQWREQILRQSASLDQSTLSKREALKAKQYKKACKQNWLSPKDLSDSGLIVDPQTELPVLDPVMQMALERNDVVVLSDGMCYAISSIAQLIDSGVVDPITSRAKLPLSNKPLTNLDYALVGRAFDPQSAGALQRLQETVTEVQLGSYVRTTPEQRVQELEGRLRVWLDERKSKSGPPYQRRARVEFAILLARKNMWKEMAQLLRELKDEEKACALVIIADHKSTKKGPYRTVMPRVAKQLSELAQSGTGLPLAKLAEKQCPMIEDLSRDYEISPMAFYSAVLQSAGNDYMRFGKSLSTFLLSDMVYAALVAQNKRAISQLLTLILKRPNVDLKTTINHALFGGAENPLPTDALMYALQVITNTPTPYQKKVISAFSIFQALKSSEKNLGHLYADVLQKFAPLIDFSISNSNDDWIMRRLANLFGTVRTERPFVQLISEISETSDQERAVRDKMVSIYSDQAKLTIQQRLKLQGKIRGLGFNSLYAQWKHNRSIRANKNDYRYISAVFAEPSEAEFIQYIHRLAKEGYPVSEHIIEITDQMTAHTFRRLVKLLNDATLLGASEKKELIARILTLGLFEYDGDAKEFGTTFLNLLRTVPAATFATIVRENEDLQDEQRFDGYIENQDIHFQRFLAVLKAIKQRYRVPRERAAVLEELRAVAEKTRPSSAVETQRLNKIKSELR